MSAPQKFRTAFNGFNREDVVHYLEYINNKHTTEINQLNSEAEFLRSQLETVLSAEDPSERIAALEQERDDLRSQLEALQARLDAKEQQPEPAAAEEPAPACGPSEELEAYRRAERTERVARERAEMMYRQANMVLSEASIRVNDLAAQITPMADQAMAQLTQLQNTISSSKQALQDAAVIISALRPNN